MVELRVPDDYPLLPPSARFKTKIFHPNVHFKVMIVQLHHVILIIVTEVGVVSDSASSSALCLELSSILTLLSLIEWTDLPGHIENNMESSMDTSGCMPGNSFTHV